MATKTATKAKPATRREPDPPARRGPPEEERNTSRAVSTAVAGAAPNAALMKRMAKDSKRGLSSDTADNLVPMIYILQSNSPQVIKRNPAYMDGAEAGTIWLRNATDPLVPGDKGLLFQPCYFTKDVVEWIDRDDGGGFVGRHPFHPGENIAQLAERLGANRVEDEKNPNRVKFILPKNNHELVETRYHVGFVHGRGNPLPFVIPLKSTGHTFSKQWMFSMNSRTLPSGDIPPSWAGLYRLFTKFKTNASGDWFMWDVEDAGWVQKEEDYDRGEALNMAFAAGDKDFEKPDETVDQGSRSSEDM